jgi:protein-S-isoprenylcysteine O-methyltransferase Ste14
MMLYLSMPLWSLVFLLMIMILQIWRAKNEARVLEAKFGDAYRGYRSKTWF